MHRIDGEGNVAGQFTEGNPGIGQPATQVTDDWLNAMQEEIAVVCETNGGLDKPNNGQLLAATDARYGRPAVATATTWAGPQVVNSGGAGGEGLALKPGASANFVFAAFYARSASPTVRSGYLGYPTAAATTLALVNEIAAGNVAITPGAGGAVQIGISGGTVALTGNASASGSLALADLLSVNNSGASGQALVLKPGSADNVYCEFYARTATPGTRSGYIGYMGAAVTLLSLKNSIASGDVSISPGTGGKVQTTGNIAFTGVSNPASTTAFTNTVTPVSNAKAWVRAGSNGSGATSIDSGHNIASVAIAAIAVPFVGNVVRVTFASAFSTSVFCAVVSSANAQSTGTQFRVGPSTTSSVDIVLSDAAGAYRDPATNAATFCLLVFGPQ